MSIDADLIDACRNGDLREVKTLLKRGANIHAWDDLALRGTATEGHLDVVKYLVEQGADIHAGDDRVLTWAVMVGHLDVANFLRETAGEKYKCHECLIRSTCLELCEDFQAGEK